MASGSNISPQFRAFVDAEELKIVIDRSLRDLSWGAHFGAIQRALRRQTFNGRPFKKLMYDFSRCTWADPLPLLYSLLSAAEFSDAGGIVRIRIPEPSNDSDRFLKFISKEGFLRWFGKVSEGRLDDGRQVIGEQQIRRYAESGVELAYVDSTLLPVHLLKARSHEEVRIWLKQQVEMLGDTLVVKVPGWAVEDALYRLRVFLLETLYNVVDHAYGRNVGYAAIYARYRRGLVGASSEHRKAVRDALSRESTICPRLPKDFLETKEGCLEATVADAGVGFSKTLSSLLVNNKGQRPRYPFREACRLVFYEGERSRTTARATRYGGLHLLNYLLGENGDFLRGHDEDEWVGTSLPLKRETADIGGDAFGRDNCGAPVTGLSWTCRISWLSATDTDADGAGSWRRWKAEAAANPILEELKSHEFDQRRFGNVLIDDKRFAHQQQGRILAHPRGAQSNYLLLPPPGLAKNDILKMVTDIGERVPADSKISLVIGDIPCHEAMTYSAALDRFGVASRTRWPSRFSRVTLVSQQFSVFALAYSAPENRLVQSPEVADRFLAASPEDGMDPSVNLRHYAQLLRYQDSRVFWQHLLTLHKTDDTYVSGNVKWTSTLEIKGYLDFSQTLADEFFRQFYKWLLQRIPSLTPACRCRLIPMDSQVRVLALDFNSTVSPRLPSRTGDDKIVIHLGSVQVTGFTQSISPSTNGPTKEIVVHFFRHPDATVECAHLLLWLKPDYLRKLIAPRPEIDYCRVGTTSAIAPASWDRFQLPRYDESGNSIYGRRPKDTYDDWQDTSPCIMKIGHWQYESNHDVLTVNLWSSLRYSLVTWGGLACFLMRNFFHALGIVAERDARLTADGRLWFENAAKHLSPQLPKVDLIVYPSHPNTHATIECLLKSLTPEQQGNIMALGPLRTNRTGSALLVSPLVTQRISGLLAASEFKRVLLFDDALISGRTSSELKHLLYSWGAKQVYTMVMLERRRLPDRVVDTETTLAYWRLDVPVAGHELTCPVCIALDKATGFANELVSNTSRARISNWQNEWKVASPLTEWSDHGLTPVAISMQSGQQKYGTRKPDSVLLTRSSGLAAYACELHTMAFRDDYASVILNQESELPPPAKIELIVSQLLLFNNEFTPDIRHNLLVNLFQSLESCTESDKHTSLAALVFFLQDKDTLSRLAQALLDGGKLDHVASNDDLAVALAYVAHLLKLGSDIGEFACDALKAAVQQLKHDEDVASLYDCFHLEIQSEFGYPHARPLAKFLAEPLYDPVPQITEVLYSIDQLRHVIGEIKPDLPRAIAFQENNSKDLLDDVVRSLSETYKVVEPLRRLRDDSHMAEAKTQVRTLNEKLKKLHERLFHPLAIERVNSDGTRYFEVEELPSLLHTYSPEELQAMRKKNGKDPFVGDVFRLSVSGSPFPTNRMDQVWVIWDSHVRLLIKNLIGNVEHSREQMHDYWKDEKGLAYMWIRVEYHVESLVITMANPSSASAETVSRMSKRGYEFFHLEELGGKVTWEDASLDDIPVLLTKVLVPYAGKARVLSLAR